MLTLKMTDYVNCASISTLLTDIDCKLTELAKILYNNTIFAISRPIDITVYIDLLNYKRILTYKLYNSEYIETYTVDMIAGKVKLLKYK